VEGRTRRENATGAAGAELLVIVRTTRPWTGATLQGQLSELCAAHGWEAATPDRIDAVISTFRQWLRGETGGRIQDEAIDDETARDAIWTMLGNAMKGRDPLDTDLLSDAVSGAGLERIRKRTRQQWRHDSHDGGLMLFLDYCRRRDARAYLERTQGLTATAARARLRRLWDKDPAKNPANVWPAPADTIWGEWTALLARGASKSERDAFFARTRAEAEARNIDDGQP
jgi:hypothetical protein